MASSMRPFTTGLLLDMPTELVTQGRHHLVREIRFAARAEALVQSGSEDVSRHRFIDRCLDRPAALAENRIPGLRNPTARDH